MDITRKAWCVVLTAIACVVGARAEEKTVYKPEWESLDTRETPQWWVDAKFGVFIHWGPYSVPAFAPAADGAKFDWDGYSEWYQGKLLAKKQVFLDHHKTFHADAPYANFAAQFRARFYDPAAWAKLFKRAGAKYVVLTSKHHDGYALWPSPESPYYNAVALGPGRDLAREFCDAMRAAGLKRGFYYSMLEYAHPKYPHGRDGKKTPYEVSIGEWNRTVNIPQLKELVEEYEADVIWPDGEWDFTSLEHGSCGFLAWLYNESKVKDTVVVNDRWGKDCRGRHGGHWTTEYGYAEGDATADVVTHPWEECRGIGGSFGYNRFETPDHYMERAKCIELLVDIVSRGGNLLLNVGPDADGLIPPIMQDRLLAMGAWLSVNGEAIYGTRAWAKRPKKMSAERVYYTEKGAALYVIVFGDPSRTVTVRGVGPVKDVALLGSDAKPVCSAAGDDLTIAPPAGAAPCEYARVYRLSR